MDVKCERDLVQHVLKCVQIFFQKNENVPPFKLFQKLSCLMMRVNNLEYRDDNIYKSEAQKRKDKRPVILF